MVGRGPVLDAAGRESDSLPSVELAWDAFRAGHDALGAASPETLLNDLRSCGAPTIQDAGDPDALNDLRQKDLELLDKWHAYHGACLEHARCEGRDPALCAVPPTRR